MERMLMSDIEGKALGERASELGSEGVSIMKDEMRATLGSACRGLSLARYAWPMDGHGN
jgi:hypothetical protein